jgi:hypothetical protein
VRTLLDSNHPRAEFLQVTPNRCFLLIRGSREQLNEKFDLVFGHSGFKGKQKEIVEAAIDGGLTVIVFVMGKGA